MSVFDWRSTISISLGNVHGYLLIMNVNNLNLKPHYCFHTLQYSK